MLQEVSWSLLKGRCHSSLGASQYVDLLFPGKSGDQMNEAACQPMMGAFGKVKWSLPT